MKYDVYLPIGRNCTPAYYLRACGLRTEAYPLDWMVFSGQAMIHLFQTGFGDFFSSVAEEKAIEGNSCRSVRDTTNDILSIHHFPKDREVVDALNDFRAMMRRRYLRLHDRLKNSGSLLMLGYRRGKEEQLENMLLEFSELYPHLSICLVHVDDDSEMSSTELLWEQRTLNDRLTLTAYHFNNRYDAVHQKKYGLWGNEAMWQRVMKEISA